MEHRRKPQRATLAQIMILPIVALLLSAAYWRSGMTLPNPNPKAIPVQAVGETPPPTSTPAPSRTPLPTPTPSTTPTHTPTSTNTPTPTATPTSTYTPTPTTTPTYTPSPTPTPTRTPTHTPTPTPLLPTPDGVDRTVRVPILMYHHISDPPPDADTIRQDLSVSPQDFDEQLRYLKSNGYESITLNDLALHLTIGKELPPKPIILTFDDGYVDAYTNAFPILQRHGFTGTVFVISAYADDGNPEFLSWPQVEEMHDAGMRFEPHSYNHPDMRNRGFDFVVFQILAPKEAIEARTGETCRFFAYPYGRYDDYVIEVLRSAHYWGAVLTEQGATHTADDLFTLRRVRVHGGDDLSAFVRALNLDW